MVHKNTTQKANDWSTRIAVKKKTGVNSGAPEGVRRSYFTSGARRFNVVTNQILSHEGGKDREGLPTNRTQTFRKG